MEKNNQIHKTDATHHKKEDHIHGIKRVFTALVILLLWITSIIIYLQKTNPPQTEQAYSVGYAKQLTEYQKKLLDLNTRWRKETLSGIENANAQASLDKAKQFIEEAQKKGETCEQYPTLSCVEYVAQTTQKANIQLRLVKYYQILTSQRKDSCVKADLGITPFLETEGISQSKKESRLFLCTGKVGDIKWRVSTNSDTKERLAALYPTVTKDNLKEENIPPTYPSGGIELNQFVTLTGHDVTSVESALQWYVNAAEQGKLTLK